MKTDTPCVLAINGGSSSVRFAVFKVHGPIVERRLGGKIDRIGLPGTGLNVVDSDGRLMPPLRIRAGDHRAAIEFLFDWLEAGPIFSSIRAAGHRVVHGMQHSEPEKVTRKLLAELRRIAPIDPDHMGREIGLIEAISRRYPKLPQIACFDTAFHRTMPQVAKLLPILRRYAAKGVVRYGFHGLSYSYLMEELARLDPLAAKGRVILAHLGNGASLAAVDRGKSIDTSMGFTPAGGLVMGTRAGDLDPGVAYYLARSERMSPARFQNMVNRQSGLLGISETSSDIRDLLSREAADPRAAEALDLFCYQARKWIGSFAAALGGVDTLVFSGGIGENAPVIRKRICGGLGFLGIDLNQKRNRKNAAKISHGRGLVTVRVIHTDEELMIARSAVRVLGIGWKCRPESRGSSEDA